jgi:hypothetical protein
VIRHRSRSSVLFAGDQFEIDRARRAAVTALAEVERVSLAPLYLWHAAAERLAKGKINITRAIVPLNKRKFSVRENRYYGLGEF